IGFAVVLKGNIDAATNEGHDASTVEVVKCTRVNRREMGVVETKAGNRIAAIIETSVVVAVVRERRVDIARLGRGWVIARWLLRRDRLHRMMRQCRMRDGGRTEMRRSMRPRGEVSGTGVHDRSSGDRRGHNMRSNRDRHRCGGAALGVCIKRYKCGRK